MLSVVVLTVLTAIYAVAILTFAVGIIRTHRHKGSATPYVSVVIPTEALAPHLYNVLSEIQNEVEPDSLDVHDKIAVVAAVGRKMAFQPGISGKIFAALGEAGINIRMINQGPDELNIIFGVDNKDFKNAIRVLYDSFVNK